MRTYLKNRLYNTFLGGWMAMVLLVFTVSQPAEASLNARGVSFQVFYDGLAPYGDWVMDPTYGYIWIPMVDAGFQPYRTNGYWVNSRFGNTWVSYYDWGWAPFHYGRWFFSDFYGWAWVPGYEWGPAWVQWRTGGGYYGWAPLMPHVGVHVSVGFPVNYWVFVPRRRFLARNIYNYYIPPRNVTVIYNQTTVINNTYVYNNRTYVAGPSRTELQRVTRSRVPVYEVANGNRPGRANLESNQLTLYRPEVTPSNRLGNAVDVRPARSYTSSEYQEMRRNASGDRAVAGDSRSSRQQENRATVPATNNPRSTASNTRGEVDQVARSPRAVAADAPASSRSAQPVSRTQPTTERGTVAEPNRPVQATPQRSAAPVQRDNTVNRPTTSESSRVQSTPSRDRSEAVRPATAGSSGSNGASIQSSQRPTSSQSQARPAASAGNRMSSTPSQGRQPQVGQTPRASQPQSRVAPASRNNQRTDVGVRPQSRSQSRVSSPPPARNSPATNSSRSGNSTTQGRRGN
ncbi:Putative prolin-rich transmembrane protein [Lunatimonas lonarensis]|uniref:Putative prolin-rich transmembrane protein n=1 Tax=Lunatimonas lonarensis TaxID=1232681 RepID=R7ZTV5_9BACT|nr:DUF6600 domain-containing protein [Lunatimonas lonarensis]EON77512.1 Putative prolin-rich transmembrane protein [Lunatimonas lonarensis]